MNKREEDTEEQHVSKNLQKADKDKDGGNFNKHNFTRCGGLRCASPGAPVSPIIWDDASACNPGAPLFSEAAANW